MRQVVYVKLISEREIPVEVTAYDTSDACNMAIGTVERQLRLGAFPGFRIDLDQNACDWKIVTIDVED